MTTEAFKWQIQGGLQKKVYENQGSAVMILVQLSQIDKWLYHPGKEWKGTSFLAALGWMNGWNREAGGTQRCPQPPLGREAPGPCPWARAPLPLAVRRLCTCAVTPAPARPVAWLQPFWAERFQTASLSCWDLVGEAVDCSGASCCLRSADGKAWAALRSLRSPEARPCRRFLALGAGRAWRPRNPWRSAGEVVLARRLRLEGATTFERKISGRSTEPPAAGTSPKCRGSSCSVRDAWMAETGGTGERACEAGGHGRPRGGGDRGAGLTCRGSSRWTPALLSPRARGCLPPWWGPRLGARAQADSASSGHGHSGPTHSSFPS